MKIAVIYLNRQHGDQKGFDWSYHTFKPGVAHELHRIDPGHPADCRWSLKAFRWAVDHIPADLYFFLNSWSHIQCDQWLEILVTTWQEKRPGILGCSASDETFYGPLARPFFPAFPNHHVRTNAFMMDRVMAQGFLPRGPFWHKKFEQFAESGRLGLTRRILAAGSTALVVDKNGDTFAPENWWEAGLYRGCFQDGLIVSDNQTRAYDLAPLSIRERLHNLAWEGIVT